MKRYKLKLTIVIVLLFIGMGITPAVTSSNSNNHTESRMIEFNQTFSRPKILEEGNFVKLTVEEAKSYLNNDGAPMIPAFSKTFELPFGTKIKEINIDTSNIIPIQLSKQIKPVPTKQRIDKTIVNIDGKLNYDLYSSKNPYPSNWIYYETGVGLNKYNEHVFFLTLHIYPVQYLPKKNIIQHIDQIQIIIKYDESNIKPLIMPSNDLIIITPSEFSDNLLPLVSHKNSYGIETEIFTLENIYNNFTGRDKAEKIKYFVKYAIEEWGSQYLLLIGDIKKLPTRTSYGSPWGDNAILTDLYYADVYNDNHSFCSWDGNNNNIFGEVIYEGGHPPVVDDIDGVDLFADINFGRIPCTNGDELDIIVNKIINYEKETYGQEWFNRVILGGGDTFPPCKWGAPNIFEGEITNNFVAEQLPNFNHVKLWTSTRNLNALTFNYAINRGAGFVSYAGHGFEMGWGTYPPNAIINRLIMYYSPYLIGMRNDHKLPIFFFDACLTAKLDFNISDVDNYYPLLTQLLIRFMNVENDPSIFYPSFAWAVLKKDNGGAIATVGATRVAYTWVDETGVYGGAGLLDVQFFKSYEKGITAGEMLTQAQNGYMHFAGKDYFTIEEYLLFGDPSLRVGGFE
jgi:hypothetical protein